MVPDAATNASDYPWDYKTMASQYELIKHTLSPISDYHFSILKNKSWMTLPDTLSEPLNDGESFEIGIFQKKDTSTNKVQAELAVLARLRDPNVTPAKEVEMYLDHKYWVKNFKLLTKQVTQTSHGEGVDAVFNYEVDGKLHTSRIAVMANEKYIFFVQGDSLSENYATYAPDFYTAINSFKP